MSNITLFGTILYTLYNIVNYWKYLINYFKYYRKLILWFHICYCIYFLLWWIIEHICNWKHLLQI